MKGLENINKNNKNNVVMPRQLFHINEEWLKKEYIQGQRSVDDLSQEIGCSSSTIVRYMKKIGIEIRKSKIILPRKKLLEYYVLNKKSSQEIADIYICSLPTVTRNLKEQNIAIRTPSERKNGALNPMFGIRGKENKRTGTKHTKETIRKISSNLPSGEKHFRYKKPQDRVEKLNIQIRTCSKAKKWKRNVMERDGARCTVCLSDKNLHIDHIIPFYVLKKHFNITSLEEAKKCDHLWQVENGRVLCEECHKKTPTWGPRQSLQQSPSEE